MLYGLYYQYSFHSRGSDVNFYLHHRVQMHLTPFNLPIQSVIGASPGEKSGQGLKLKTHI